MLGGMVIGLPPVMNFGSEELKKKILPEVFNAKKFICLAVTEGVSANSPSSLLR
jgi:alkylation response protein AidB-like acyl-CoA dehydrogenase